MQVNIEFEFTFMLSIRSATAPPHPTCSALPPFEAIACQAAVWSKCENSDAGSGTEFELICVFVAGAISVPVLATIAARPALKRFCNPVNAGFKANVRPLCGVFGIIGSSSLMGYANPGAPDLACVNALNDAGSVAITVPCPS